MRWVRERENGRFIETVVNTAGKDAQGGGFSRPVVAHDRHMLPLVQHEVRILQRMNPAIPLRQAPRFQNDLRHIAHPRVR